MVQRMNLGLAFPANAKTKPGDQPPDETVIRRKAGGRTLVLNGEVGGDQRWNLTSDVCAVHLPPVFGPVVLDNLGLRNTPVLR